MQRASFYKTFFVDKTRHLCFERNVAAGPVLYSICRDASKPVLPVWEQSRTRTFAKKVNRIASFAPHWKIMSSKQRRKSGRRQLWFSKKCTQKFRETLQKSPVDMSVPISNTQDSYYIREMLDTIYTYNVSKVRSIAIWDAVILCLPTQVWLASHLQHIKPGGTEFRGER